LYSPWKRRDIIYLLLFCVNGFLLLFIFNLKRICKQMIVNIPNSKFHGNRSIGIRNVSYCKTDGLTEMLKVIAGLANCFANTPKMASIFSFVDLSNAKHK
jgi:hypothetical protein